MITIRFEYLPQPPDCRVLDIGCGSGRHAAAVYEYWQTHVVGADPNLDDLHQAAERLRLHERLGAHRGGCWSLAAADITALPFAANFFDLVICSEVLEHIADDKRAIEEIVRILKPGCNLVVSVPRRWPETLCWALSRSYRNTLGGHIRIYSRKRLIRLFRSRNMIYWHTHFAHSLHTPYWWLKCLLGLEKDNVLPVKLYHRFLTWDLLSKPKLTRLLDKLLNPLLGKSVVLYFRKPATPP
jgi:ubiquinone/menaquinone biosynthesis C-methylase UbiE